MKRPTAATRRPLKSRRAFLIFVFFSILVMGVTPSFSQETAPIGTVTRLKGQVFAERDGRRIPLHVGSTVQTHDTVKTGLVGRVEMTLNDDTVLTFADRTTLKVDDYDFPGPGSRAKFNLLLGALRAVSGAIAQTNPDAFIVTTPVATIGIRGTDFWVGTVDSAFNVVLISGSGVYVKNQRGRVELTEAGQGTVINVPGVRLPDPDAPDEEVSLILGEMAREALSPTPPTLLPAARISSLLDRVQF